MNDESSCEQMVEASEDKVDAGGEEILHGDSSDDDRSGDDGFGEAISLDLKVAQELTGR